MSFIETARATAMPDGRLRLSHGPIDMIVTAEGPDAAMRAAYHRAQAEFLPLLKLNTPIVPAVHRNNSGIIGAAALSLGAMPQLAQATAAQ